MPSMEEISSGSGTIDEASRMRFTHIAPLPLDYTGHCYGRSPPSGAGREAAGHTSKASSHIGTDPAPLPVRILRAQPKAFTNGNHLRYEGLGPDDIYVSDVDDKQDDSGSHPPISSADHAFNEEVPCGYQDRRALRGSHRGQRSADSRLRRFNSWKDLKRTSRHDFRQWKSQYKDSTLRTHGDQNPKPLVCPTSAVQSRLQSQAQKFSKGPNQLRRSDKSISVPLPSGFDINIATRNVESLREVAKYDQIICFLNSRNIHLLAAQETKSDSVHTFAKSGWEILHSGASNSRHHGVGFCLSFPQTAC